jgi:hypothetical protein
VLENVQIVSPTVQISCKLALAGRQENAGAPAAPEQGEVQIKAPEGPHLNPADQDILETVMDKPLGGEGAFPKKGSCCSHLKFLHVLQLRCWRANLQLRFQLC